MIDTIKKIWAGPFQVKISLVFIFSVILVFLLAAPGQMLFLLGLMYSVYQIANWMDKDE